MVEYNTKSQLYDLAYVGLCFGGVLTGLGAGRIMHKGEFGLEELITGLAIAGSSIYYRYKSRMADCENKTPEK